MLNVLQFKYIHPSLLSISRQILNRGPTACKELTSRYVLMCSPTNPNLHVCVIYEIMYQDFERYRGSALWTYLEEMKSSTSPDIFNRMVPSDDSIFKRKILNTLCFAMDKVYKCDELLVTFDKYIKDPYEIQGVPNAIYHVLQEHFDIVSQSLDERLCLITIKKRSSKDDNNAD